MNQVLLRKNYEESKSRSNSWSIGKIWNGYWILSKSRSLNLKASCLSKSQSGIGSWIKNRGDSCSRSLNETKNASWSRSSSS